MAGGQGSALGSGSIPDAAALVVHKILLIMWITIQNIESHPPVALFLYPKGGGLDGKI